MARIATAAIRFVMLVTLLPLAASFVAPCTRLHAVASCSRVAMTPLMEAKVITCSKCKATFEVDEADFVNGKEVQCGGTGCDYKWFQTADRLQTIPDVMELIDYPQEMKDRIAAGKPAEPVGLYRCFVGNLPFSATEEELREVFERYGAVANVVIMTDDEGRPRGFGFVNFESLVAGANAVAELDGYMLQGRTISVSEGKQSTSPRAPNARTQSRLAQL